jgi:hypothetical protein
MKKVWSIDGHSDGDKIPKEMHAEIAQQVECVEKTRPWYPRLRIQSRIRNQFCYIEIIEKDGTFSPVCRLRYFKNLGWSMAFYVWGCGRYQATTFGETDFVPLDRAIKAGIQSGEFVHFN